MGPASHLATETERLASLQFETLTVKPLGVTLGAEVSGVQCNGELSGEIIASVTEHDISVLKAAPKRVAFPDVPIPFARVMEQFCLPNPDKIVAAWDEMQAA